MAAHQTCAAANMGTVAPPVRTVVKGANRVHAKEAAAAEAAVEAPWMEL